MAARVKLEDLNGFQTAVGQDGGRTGASRSASSGRGPSRRRSPGPGSGTTWSASATPPAESPKLYLDGDLVDTKSACLGDKPSGNTVIGRGKFGGPTDFWEGVNAVRTAVFDRVYAWKWHIPENRQHARHGRYSPAGNSKTGMTTRAPVAIRGLPSAYVCLRLLEKENVCKLEVERDKFWLSCRA